MGVTGENAHVWWVTPELFDEHPEFREEALAWIRSVGLNPDRLLPEAGITPFDGQFELHADEIDYHGDLIRMDPLRADTFLTRRVIVAVPEGSWPVMPEEVAA